jgi:ankyrin repeat protein
MTIWEAAEDGDLAEVQQLVGQNPGLLDAKEGECWTPLMYASLSGHVNVVRWLLDWGAAIDERQGDERTALHIACVEKHIPVVRLLLERGADPFSSTCKKTGLTPLLISCYQGHLEVVRWLLGHPSAKANINHCNLDGHTALSYACHYGRAGVVRALLENGADPTIATNSGHTPMFFAQLDADYPEGVTAADRQRCVAALEVRSDNLFPPLQRHVLC